MTSARAQIQEELAALMHTNWVREVRTVLYTIEPFIKGVPRRPENKTVWESFDRLLLLSTKKWECLKGDERSKALAEAEQVIKLLQEVGEIQ